MNPPRPEIVPHHPEDIVGECPHCRLPIYRADDKTEITLVHWQGKQLYHSGCAWRAEVKYHTDRLQHHVRELRRLQCTVTVQLTIPVV